MGKLILTRDLSNCETLIMKVIWEAKGDIAVQDLIARLRDEYDKDYARTTVVTFVRKLVDKGFVSTYRIRKTAYIHPEKDEKRYVEQMMHDETCFWFQGLPSQLLSAVCSSQKVSKSEIQKMRDLLDELDD